MDAGDELPYDQMLERALRGVVREALGRAAANGLPGDHHFYVTFRTDYPGVDIHKSLRAQYPDEMTVVLQHQFWNLGAGNDSFGVTLSFSGVPYRLVVPYEAVTAFADPSVNFALRFQGLDAAPTGETTGAGGAPPAAAEAEADEASADVADLSSRFQRQRSGDPSDADSDAGAADGERTQPAGESETAEGDADSDDATEGGSAEVVTLDAFRKKK